MSDVAIRVEGLGKRYQLSGERRGAYRTLREELVSLPGRLRRASSGAGEAFWALQDVSFEVKRGEVLGVIGRNGAGKSTLLKILSRIVEPTTGEADIHGRVGALLEVGTGFHPELTGRENIYLSGALLGMRRSEVTAQLDEIVAFAGVERFLDTPCKRYSSGMFARLGFAVAAFLRCEILVVDEALAVGDLDFQRRCLGAMRRMADGGRTVLLVSHDLPAVSALGSRCLWLADGRVAADGPAEEVLRAYRASLPGAVAPDGGWPGPIHGFRAGHPDGGGLVAGEPAELVLRIHLSAPQSGLLAGGGLDTDAGSRLCTLYSHFTGMAFDLPAGESELVCRIERLPLGAGRYLVSLHLATSMQTLDHLDHWLEVEVQPGDFFGTGRLPSKSQGSFLVDQHWQLQ